MNVRIAQHLVLTAGSWYNDTLEMNQYSIKLWMMTQSTSEQEQNIAFLRMKQFVYGELDSTIFIDSSETEKCRELAQAGLNITPLPGLASDQLVGIMLFHKLNAIMEGRIDLIEVEISAGDGVIYLHGENETPADLQQPSWWSSADLTHSDMLSTVDNLINIHPVLSWRDLDLDWPDNLEPPPSGNTIVFADFKKSNDTE